MKSRANLLFGLLAGGLAMSVLFASLGYEQTWRLWGVGPMSPHFADLRVITGAAASVARGYDPMLSNPGDPWLRPLNYPRVWQGLLMLGIDDRDTTWLGVVLIALFLLGLLLAVHCPTRGETIWIMAAVLSPATLLGVERGNIDLLIFFLLAVAVALARRHQLASTCVILFAFVLKLFPIFGLTLLLRQSRRTFLISAGAAALLALAYVGATLEDVLLIGTATPRATDVSYGMNVARMRFAPHTSLAMTYGGIVVGTAVAIAALLAFAALRHGPANNEDAPGDRIDAFRIGAGIYIGTFFLGNNFDYRLIFLIFTIPQLLAWSHQASRMTVRLARVALLGIYLSMWYMLIVRFAGAAPGGVEVSYIVDELANWAVFAVLFRLLMQSAPSWMHRREAVR